MGRAKIQVWADYAIQKRYPGAGPAWAGEGDFDRGQPLSMVGVSIPDKSTSRFPHKRILSHNRNHAQENDAHADRQAYPQEEESTKDKDEGIV